MPSEGPPYGVSSRAGVPCPLVSSASLDFAVGTSSSDASQASIDQARRP
jgi:hypothetical protein